VLGIELQIIRRHLLSFTKIERPHFEFCISFRERDVRNQRTGIGGRSRAGFPFKTPETGLTRERRCADYLIHRVPRRSNSRTLIRQKSIIGLRISGSAIQSTPFQVPPKTMSNTENSDVSGKTLRTVIARARLVRNVRFRVGAGTGSIEIQPRCGFDPAG